VHRCAAGPIILVHFCVFVVQMRERDICARGAFGGGGNCCGARRPRRSFLQRTGPGPAAARALDPEVCRYLYKLCSSTRMCRMSFFLMWRHFTHHPSNVVFFTTRLSAVRPAFLLEKTLIVQRRAAAAAANPQAAAGRSCSKPASPQAMSAYISQIYTRKDEKVV